MRELSLFSGAGGGLYGSKLLDWSTIGYVEFNEYCQKVIAQRIEDGIFDRAPIFTDVREFVKSGAARAYRGFVDVVSGGFPCQPFSVAGKREASNDERDMWPATMDVIKAVEPPVVFLENVPGLLSATVDDESGRPVHYFGAILRDLAKSGYDVKWCVLGAGDVGAPHRRNRLWILAALPHAHSSQRERDSKPERIPEKHPYFSGGSWWAAEPALGRVHNGVANRCNRLKAIGNGQVSICMALAYEILSREFANNDRLNSHE